MDAHIVLDKLARALRFNKPYTLTSEEIETVLVHVDELERNAQALVMEQKK